MPSEGGKVSTSVNIPQMDFPPTPTCECSAVRTERYAIDIIRMPREGGEVSTSVDIPQTDGVVITPLASVLPSGLNDTLLIPSAGPVRVVRFLPVSTSHRRTVSSRLPLASVLPSGLNDTLSTSSVCPVRVVRFLPVSTSHRRTVSSRLHLRVFCHRD